MSCRENRYKNPPGSFINKTIPGGDTWQDMFSARKPFRQNPTISLELAGNTATVKWRPRFIAYKCGKGILKSRLPASSPELEAYARLAIEGALRWDSDVFPNPNPLVIRGAEGKFIVKIYDKTGRLYRSGDSLAGYDFAADNYASSNFALFLGRRDSAIVWDAFGWNPRKKLRVKMGVSGQGGTPTSYFTRTAEHEFGHVLGLFDAYGYAKKADPPDGSRHYGGHSWPDGLLPPAHIDGIRILQNSVMVCDYLAAHESEAPKNIFARTSLDYEMVLLAFQKGKLQLYSDCILGKRSRAFCSNRH